MMPFEHFTERNSITTHAKHSEPLYFGSGPSVQSLVKNVLLLEHTTKLRTEPKLHSSSLYNAMVRLSYKSKKLRPDLANIKISSFDKKLEQYSTTTIPEKIIPSLNPISITCLVPKVPPGVRFEKEKRFKSNLTQRNTYADSVKNNQNFTRIRISKSSKRLQDFLKSKQQFKPSIMQINFEENIRSKEVKVMSATIFRSFSPSRSLKLIEKTKNRLL